MHHWYQEETLVNPDNIIAIDLGVENLATCVSNIETPFIMDGRKLKSTISIGIKKKQDFNYCHEAKSKNYSSD